MAQFLFLPDSKEIINLDLVQAAFLAVDPIPGESPVVEVIFTGDPEEVAYGGTDAEVILTALAAKLGTNAEALAEELMPDEDEDETL